jgi:predicted nucleic acid-binding protein
LILLDTSVLSAALRRRQQGIPEKKLSLRLLALLEGGERVAVPGLVLQEILAGIREDTQLQRIKTVLMSGYPIVVATVDDHLLAADIANKCRRRGVATSTGDALIAALAIERKALLFTVDADFEHLARIVPLKLLPLE